VAVVPGVLASVVNLPNVSYRTLAGAPSSPKWLPSIAALNGPPAVRNMITALRASKPVQVRHYNGLSRPLRFPSIRPEMYRCSFSK
jgi:hypothetical protein